MRHCLLLLVLALPATAVAQPPASAAFDLEACRRSARDLHPRLAAARAQAAAAEARKAIAFSGFLPSLSAEGSFTAVRGAGGQASSRPAGVELSPTLLGAPDYEVWGVGLTLKQTIWDFGRTLHGHAAAAATQEAAEQDAQALLETLDVEAEAAFRTAMAADELVVAMEEASARAASHLARARARTEVGLRPRYDVSRAEVELSNAALALVAAKNARELARAQLANACGLAELPADGALVVPAARAAPELPSLEQAIAEALARRSEIAAAQARVEAAERALSAARALHLPSLVATGTVNYRGSDIQDLGGNWSALLQVNVPLLAGGADAARVREAEANLALARASLENTRRLVRLDIESAFLAMREAGARMAAAKALEVSASEGMQLAEVRYETGSGDALELADAQAAFASARATSVRATLDASVAAARLERALGRRSLPSRGEDR